MLGEPAIPCTDIINFSKQHKIKVPFDHQQAIQPLQVARRTKMFNVCDTYKLKWESNPKQEILFECLSLDNIIF